MLVEEEPYYLDDSYDVRIYDPRYEEEPFQGCIYMRSLYDQIRESQNRNYAIGGVIKFNKFGNELLVTNKIKDQSYGIKYNVINKYLKCVFLLFFVKLNCICRINDNSNISIYN
jgi:hypothetical protein